MLLTLALILTIEHVENKFHVSFMYPTRKINFFYFGKPFIIVDMIIKSRNVLVDKTLVPKLGALSN